MKRSALYLLITYLLLPLEIRAAYLSCEQVADTAPKPPICVALK